MSVIHILPEAVANKIAAGEVVERPASVVKELMENALDAGAGRIEVDVEAGGKRRIQVVDEGCGMGHDDALLAFERHATSKIRSAEDLSGIATLGFRGEALPSIAAVSRLVLETRYASEPTGTRVEFAGGKLRDVKEAAWSTGTRVEVRDLFFNTPARRKFLKSESTELGHIASLATHYALAHPEKSFRLNSLTNEILNVSPVGTLRERVYQVLGGQLLEQLIEISPLERRLPADLSLEPDQPGVEREEPGSLRVTGFVSRPEVQKLNRNQIYFFVNRRLVRDRVILHAIVEAYRNIIPAATFPVTLIFLHLPPGEVDVNVHPSKTEVRFRHSQFVHDFVRDSIRQALLAARPVAAFPVPRQASQALPQEESVPARSEAAFSLSAPHPLPESGTLPLQGDPEGPSPFHPPVDGPILHAYGTGPGPSMGDRPPSVEVEGCGTELQALPAEAGSPAPAGEFPTDLDPLGQIQESFIVATNAEGLWIVDQHVAHERILFERHLRQRRQKKVEVQRLLLPIVLELKPEQQVVFQELAAELATDGFEVEPFGQRTVAIKTAPADLAADRVEQLLVEILDGVGREARTLSRDVLTSRIAASIACHAAIKVNMALETQKMDWLLRELGRTECPMACPHGRPIVLRYGIKEIQKAFKRI